MHRRIAKGAKVKRSRRGGRRPQGSHSHGGGGGNNGGGGHFNPNRTYDSNGPEVKIRGSATHIYEKYLQLARDANSGGDRVMAENYLQHAEHYYRIMAATQAQQQQYQAQLAQQQQAQANAQGNQQPYADSQGQPGQQPQANGQNSSPAFSLNEPQGEAEDEGEETEAQA